MPDNSPDRPRLLGPNTYLHWSALVGAVTAVFWLSTELAGIRAEIAALRAEVGQHISGSPTIVWTTKQQAVWASKLASGNPSLSVPSVYDIHQLYRDLPQ